MPLKNTIYKNTIHYYKIILLNSLIEAYPQGMISRRNSENSPMDLRCPQLRQDMNESAGAKDGLQLDPEWLNPSSYTQACFVHSVHTMDANPPSQFI